MSPSTPVAEDGGAQSQKLQILVTDDEPMLRSVIGDFIETLDGCHFCEAGDGIEALEYVRTHPVDCLLSDMRMPRMDLEELVGILVAEFPDLIIIATSGYSDADNAWHILDRGAHEFLAKPLDLDELERTLHWVPARARTLEFAADLFGKPESIQAPDWMGRFDALSRALVQDAGPFAPLMLHARRTADLSAIVMKGRYEPLIHEMMLAALLHEAGASSHHLELISERRPLKPAELQLVRIQPAIGARLASRRLPGRMAGAIIRNHLAWLDEDAAGERQWDDTRGLCCLLGVINALDGIVHDRLDRKKNSLEEAHSMLKGYYARTNLTALKQTLSAWGEIEEFYARASAAAETKS